MQHTLVAKHGDARPYQTSVTNYFSTLRGNLDCRLIRCISGACIVLWIQLSSAVKSPAFRSHSDQRPRLDQYCTANDCIIFVYLYVHIHLHVYMYIRSSFVGLWFWEDKPIPCSLNWRQLDRNVYATIRGGITKSSRLTSSLHSTIIIITIVVIM